MRDIGCLLQYNDDLSANCGMLDRNIPHIQNEELVESDSADSMQIRQWR